MTRKKKVQDSPMSAITVSRQMGSQGDELASQIAQRLGWRRIGRDLINKAAQAAGVPHVALADIDELGLLNLRPSAKEWRVYQQEVAQLIHLQAEVGGVVIVGRGGQMVLRERSDVLHVRVVAPLETRLARLQQEKISVEAARARLEASDKAQARYLRRSHNARLDDPALYHLVVNTGLLSLSQAVNLLIEALHTCVGSAPDDNGS